MSDYLYKKAVQEINDLESFFDVFNQLKEKANKNGSVYDYEHDEWFKWLNHDTLFSKSYTDETCELLKWKEINSYNLVTYFCSDDCNDYYMVQMGIGQGTELSFHKLSQEEITKEIKDISVPEIGLYSLVKIKLDYLKSKLESWSKKYQETQKAITEYQKRLRAVDAANALMEIFDLKMSDESIQKVETWKQELEKLQGR